MSLIIPSFALGRLDCSSTYVITYFVIFAKGYSTFTPFNQALQLFARKSYDEQVLSACTALKYNLGGS